MSKSMNNIDVIRAVPADFEDTLTLFLRNEFIDDTNVDECEETIKFLVQKISSMFIEIKNKKKSDTQVSAYTMFLRSKDNGDWKTMTDEEKMKYRIMADEENVRRGSKVLNVKRVSAQTLFKEEFPNGIWNDLTVEQQEKYKKKSSEKNKNTKKIPSNELETKSYKKALIYLRKNNPEKKFATWTKLNQDGHNAWCSFVEKNLTPNMDKDFYNDLVYDAANKYCELFVI